MSRPELPGVARGWLPAACTALLAFLVNCLPVGLPLGAAFFLGGSIAVARLLAGSRGSFAAGVAAALSGFALTGQPLLLLPLLGEALVLGRVAASRRSLQAASFLYWLFAGAPAAAVLLRVTGAGADAVLLGAMALAANGLLNTTLGVVLAWLVRRPGGSLGPREARQMRDVMASALMPVVILPSALLLFLYAHAAGDRATRIVETMAVTQASLMASVAAEAAEDQAGQGLSTPALFQRRVARLLELAPDSTLLTLRAGTIHPVLSFCRRAPCAAIDPVDRAAAVPIAPGRLPSGWTGQVALGAFGDTPPPSPGARADTLQVDLWISTGSPREVSIRFSARSPAHGLARAIAAGLVLFVLVYGIVLLASRMVAAMASKPLERLSSVAARSGGEGDGPETRNTGIIELDRLTEVLASGRAQLQRALADQLQVIQGLERLGRELPFLFLVWSDLRGPGKASTLAYSSSSPDQRFDVPPELFGNLSLWLARIHPEDRPAVLSRLREAPSAGQFEATYRIRQRSGDWIWVSNACLLFPGAGGRTAAVGYWLDVTTQRASENRAHQTSKLRLLGEMATGMAHELNQPLNTIRLAAENMHYALDTKVPEGVKGDMFRKIDRIIQQAVRASQMIERMRVFGRPSALNMRWVHPSALIEAAIDATRATFDQAGINIRSVGDPEVPGILVDRVQIEQALANVLTNACDATIRRSEREQDFDRSEAEVVVRLRHVPGAGDIFIDVEDQAGGIDPALRDRVIEPFFTTKLPGDGPGLGLTLAYGVVREHGGDIDISNGALGAMFTLRLPIGS